jgi:protoporphyrinogen/coproporphyrinogen III oxidase
MTPVAIVGGGITGLTAAFYLQRQNIPVTLYESSSRTGGMIQTMSRDGFLVEHGPNTILESAPEVSALVSDLELKSRCLYPAAGMKARYVVRDGRTLRLPQSAMAAVRTPLLSLRAKIGVLGEPFVSRGILEDEPLSAFVIRRLGSELLDYLIDPFVGGVYAGDPDCLSVAHAFPKLHALEQTYGSLIKGALLGARARRKRGVVSKVSALMLTFDAGLAVLVEALQARLDAAVHLDSVVTGVRRDEPGWTIETSAGASRKHSAVLLCAPAYRVAGIKIDSGERQDLAPLREIYYPPIARVAVGFRRDQIAHALDGFGVLIPNKERMNTLGILFSSSLFPNRAPAGCALLTAYLGGSRGRDVVNTTDAGLIELALTDMRKLLGASGPPVFEDVVRIPRSIPQYNVGYGGVKDAIGKLEAQTPGVFIASSYRHGISVADCIVGGRAASEKVLQYIADA